MDLSNLGIAYRALGRADVAHGLFERAHKIMLTTLGPADPKTKAILRNLASAQASAGDQEADEAAEEAEEEAADIDGQVELD